MTDRGASSTFNWELRDASTHPSALHSKIVNMIESDSRMAGLPSVLAID